jgi:hypothetical protein
MDEVPSSLSSARNAAMSPMAATRESSNRAGLFIRQTVDHEPYTLTGPNAAELASAVLRGFGYLASALQAVGVCGKRSPTPQTDKPIGELAEAPRGHRAEGAMIVLF